MLLLFRAQQFTDGPFTDIHEHLVTVTVAAVVVVIGVAVAIVVARPNVNPVNVPMFSTATPIPLS